MIFNKNTGMQQVNELLHLHSGLQIDSEDENQITLVGSILVNRSAKEYVLYQEYIIKIVVPLHSCELPYVIDTGNYIDNNYPHRYSHGKLCLETDTSIRIRFVDGLSLPVWLSEYVETYFFSYEYYQRYGEYPFGDRGHGIEGIFQTYEELFMEPDVLRVLKLMKSIVSQPYRGHTSCPCGSGKRIRTCHGAMVMKYYTDNRLNKIVRDDYNMIMEEFIKYDEQQRNSKQTK